MICPRCGMEITEGSKFCHKCGFHLDQLSGQAPSGGMAPPGIQAPQAAAHPSQYQPQMHQPNQPVAQLSSGQQQNQGMQVYQQAQAGLQQIPPGVYAPQQPSPQQYGAKDAPQAVTPRKQKKYAEGKSAILQLALILSLLIVGVGQFYNGDTKKGIIMLVAALIGGCVSCSILWWIAAIYSSVDAYMVASKKWPIWD